MYRALQVGGALHGDLDLDDPVSDVLLVLEVDDVGVQGLFGLVQVLDELPNPAFVLECRGVAVAFVDQRDGDAGVEEGQLAQARLERREDELAGLEDLVVGPEPDRRPGLLSGFQVADPFEFSLGFAVVEALLPDRAVALDLDLEPLRERVDDAHADPVEATGDLVGFVVELPARVEDGHHHFDGRDAVLFLYVDGDAAAVVADGDRAVVVNRHADGVTVPRQRLVDGVVDDLVDEMVEPPRVGRANIHRGPFPDGLEPLEGLDRLCAVLIRLT